MSSISKSVDLDRAGDMFNVVFDYAIDPYVDPETGETFGDTSWTATINEVGGGSGSQSDYGGESNAAYVGLGSTGDDRVHHLTVQFTAMNTFSGVSVALDTDIFLASGATSDQTIAATAGDDIVVAGLGDDLIRGGIGGDALYAGGGNDIVDGGAGADLLNGEDGDDTLIGGAGNDSYVVDSPLDLVIEAANGGLDTVFSAVNLTLAANVETLALTANAATGVGNDLDNRIDGNVVANRLEGGEGADTLNGGGGIDTMLGGAGNDRLDGGPGGDSMSGGLGDDVYVVDAATDRVSEAAGEGRDKVLVLGLASYGLGANVEDLATGGSAAFLGVGNDLANAITGGAGSDSLLGKGGADILEGGAGADNLTGGAGPDTLIGGAGVDTARYDGSAAVVVDLAAGTASGGDAQGDVLYGIENVVGSGFGDRLTGDAGANQLQGLAGHDQLSGGAGGDTLIGGAGHDYMDGGADIDTLSYAGSLVGISVNLATRAVSGGDADGDAVFNFENVAGSNGDDALTGSGGANVLVGGLGSDTLSGGAGADTLSGGAGGDRLDGGADTDVVSYTGSVGAVTVNLLTQTTSGGDAQGDTISGIESVGGGTGNDTLIGSDGVNSLSGGAGADSIGGGGGSDLITGGAGGDYLDGGAGIDTLSYAGSTQGVYVDLAGGVASGGDASGDTVGNFEAVLGSAFGDALYGDNGANRLTGGAGFDFLSGGGGNDVLIGGADGDTFAFDSGGGRDTIADFIHGQDVLELSLGPSFDSFADVMAVGHQSGANTVFAFGATTALTLLNVTLSTLTPDDFLFG